MDVKTYPFYPLNGDLPHLERGIQSDYSVLIHTPYEMALMIEKAIPPGYGLIEQGTVMAHIWQASSPRIGKIIPYTPVRPTANNRDAIGAAYLRVDGAANKEVWVPLLDSYKFMVGDRLAVADNTNYADQGEGALDLGPITAIDRTSDIDKAKLTVTNNVTVNYTVARSAWVWHATKDSTPFTQASGILASGVHAGYGEKAAGGGGQLIIKNAMLYKTFVKNLDDAALSVLFARIDGRFVII